MLESQLCSPHLLLHCCPDGHGGGDVGCPLLGLQVALSLVGLGPGVDGHGHGGGDVVDPLLGHQVALSLSDLSQWKRYMLLLVYYLFALEQSHLVMPRV